MFVDEATISVRSGRGGDGCVSFRREANVPKGGPDGGDGGRGGDVWVAATSQKNTLVDYRHRHHARARNGRPGEGGNRTGRSADDLVLEVPAGTLVYEHETNRLLADLDEPGARVCVAQGGRGGKGNARFASATNRAPRRATPGGDYQELTLRLELKLLADVGLVGFPSVGKSTLIAAISSCRPAIADYPFTTLTPNLGVVERYSQTPFVVADIPGLIEGAHEGRGLGIQFLKHVQRTRLLVHLLDCTRPDPHDDYETLRRELAAFDEGLARKPELVVLNKVDALPGGIDDPLVRDVAAFCKTRGAPFLAISAAGGQGCDRLVAGLARALRKLNRDEDTTD